MRIAAEHAMTGSILLREYYKLLNWLYPAQLSRMRSIKYSKRRNSQRDR